MTRITIELSGESLPLAVAELAGACRALDGEVLSVPEGDSEPRSAEAALPDRSAAVHLAARLALAYRVIEFRGTFPGRAEEWWAPGPEPGQGAAFRWLGHDRRSATDPAVVALAHAWTDAGGRIDLTRPERRFWLRSTRGGGAEVGEELGAIDRSAILARRISRLPFRRPVGLDPRLARAAVNMGAVRPGDRVVDPFVGTGALMAEAALLGARVTGVDVDAEMIRGATRNFAYLGVAAETWVVADAAELPSVGDPLVPLDALVTDVPYGRSSGTQGEPVADLLRRTLPLWAARLRPEGRIVIVSSGPVDAVPAPWTPVRSVAVRQHRSLTRTFTLYERRRAPVTRAGSD